MDRKISSWLPGANGATVFAYGPSEPAGWVSSSSSSPSTASPPSPSPLRRHAVSLLSSPSRQSPPPSSSHRASSTSPRSRKLSAPPTVRRAETQLRSVLAVLDEDNTRAQLPSSSHHNNNAHSQPSLPSSQDQNRPHHGISVPPPSSAVLDDGNLSGTASDRPDLRVDISGHPHSNNRDVVSDNDHHHQHHQHSSASGVVAEDGDQETPRNLLAMPASTLLFPSGPEVSYASTSQNGSATRTPTESPRLRLPVTTDVFNSSGWSE